MFHVIPYEENFDLDMTHVYRCRYLSTFTPRFLGVALMEEPMELEIVITYESTEVCASHDLRIFAHYVIQHLQAIQLRTDATFMPLYAPAIQDALRLDNYQEISNWLLAYNEISLFSAGDSFWIVLK